MERPVKQSIARLNEFWRLFWTFHSWLSGSLRIVIPCIPIDTWNCPDISEWFWDYHYCWTCIQRQILIQRENSTLWSWNIYPPIEGYSSEPCFTVSIVQVPTIDIDDNCRWCMPRRQSRSCLSSRRAKKIKGSNKSFISPYLTSKLAKQSFFTYYNWQLKYQETYWHQTHILLVIIQDNHGNDTLR